MYSSRKPTHEAAAEFDISNMLLFGRKLNVQQVLFILGVFLEMGSLISV
jgi:hypothetical protein